MLIEADLHCHSLASSHAYSTLKELAQSASECGLKAFALTDHAPAMPDSPHVWHFRNMNILPRKICGVTVIRGVEANVTTFDGDIDMTDFDLENVEWVVASCHIHVLKPGTLEENTQTYARLFEKNPVVDAIGHCTTSRYPVDFEQIVKICLEHNKLIELNESSVQYKAGSRENAYELMRLCKKYGARIVVNTDTHYCDQIGKTPLCEEILSAVDFPESLIFNADAERVLEYISRKNNINLSGK